MGIFTSKKTTWRRGIQKDTATRTRFNQLAQTIGRKQAEKYLEVIYTWAGDRGTPVTSLSAAIMNDFLKWERENVTSKHQYVHSLMPLTKSGALGTLLNAHIRPLTDYYKNPAGGGLAGRELAIDKAANWICGGYVAGLPATRALLGEYIPTNPAHPGKAGNALGRTPDHMKKIHKKAVPNAPAYRFNYATGAVKYPSTVGAAHLLDGIFRITAGQARWPPFGDAHWESIAMFLMVSIVTVQAFSDGNKRAGHLAYAIVLIKGTHDFKAPTTAKETELFRMNG